MSNEEVKAWDRQSGETVKAYAAFRCYLEMPDRSLPKVAQKLSKCLGHIKKWSRKFDWSNRAIAYDSSIVEEVRCSLIDKIKIDIERKHSVAAKLEKLFNQAVDVMSPNRISPHVLTELASTANQLRNEAIEVEKALGESTKVTKIIIQRRGE